MPTRKLDPAFKGPLLKVRRARRHINEIYTLQQHYFGRRPYAIFEEIGQNGLQIFKVRSTLAHPEDLDAAVADTLGSLRSSLDLAVCAAATVAGATDLKHTYFHTAASEAGWDESVKGRTRAAPAHVVDIMRSFQPWPSGNPLLSALAKLAVADKHQLLTPIVLGPVSLEGATIKACADDSSIFNEPPNWDAEKKEAIIAKVGSGKIALSNVRISGYIGFGQVHAMAGEPVVRTLNEMADMCQRIIETIALSMIRP